MLEIPAHDLFQILTQASLFAHQSNELPSINAVLLEFDGKDLLAVATDRFKLAVIRYPIMASDPSEEATLTPFKTSLPLDQVRLLASHLKTPVGLRDVRHVTIDIGSGDYLGVQDTLAPNIFNVTNSESQVTVNITPVSNTFPRWRHLLPPIDPTEGGTTVPVLAGVDAIGLGANHIGAVFKLANLRGHNSLAFIFTSAQQRVVVHVDENCLAIVMPMRLESKPVTPEWAHTVRDATGKDITK